MTELLYMNDIESNYIREFDAKVVRVGEDYIVLDQSAFYPEGGGQPTDTGIIQWGDNIKKVNKVLKKAVIKHVIEPPLPEVGSEVSGALDWPRRHAHMRMHTAQHLISGMVYDMFNARTVGNQIHAEYSRVDFQPIAFTDDMLAELEKTCNDLIDRKLAVTITERERADLDKELDAVRSNLDLIPKSIKKLRIVSIEDFDIIPCAGTHIRNLEEVGHIKITKKEGKGKEKERIVYTLVQPGAGEGD
jgi:misacylated tRNA(Ala) deacylase